MRQSNPKSRVLRQAQHPEHCRGIRSTKSIFIIFFLSLFLIGVSYAQEDLLIEAENISYSETGNQIEASGSVEATYENLTIYCNRLVYDSTQKIVSIEDKFTLNRPSFSLHGKGLKYNIISQNGSASNVNLTADGVFLTGKKITLGKEEISLNQASFTT